jgi:ABC-type nitrate/sulfonate/bicarbonate transport system substrate-binding protein
MECWSTGVLGRKPITPPLQYSINPRQGGTGNMKARFSVGGILFAIVFSLASTAAAGEEIFIGNPGKSLNFFHFDLAIEKGYFKELGLDVKLLNTKCDIAVTALLTGDLQATGCVGSASRFIASQNVPVRTVIWLFKKPTFYVVARPDIKSAADLKGKTIGISSFGSDTDLSMKTFAQSGKLDPEKDIKRIVAGSTSTRLQGLKAGSLDATTLSPPFNVYAEQMGLRILAYVGDFLEFPQSGFTVSDATLKNKRDVIKRLLRGTLRGLQLTLKNRAETVRFIAKDYKLQESVADRVYTSLLPAMSENGLATDRGLKVMIDTLGTAFGKNVDFSPDRLVDYTLLREVQKELGIQ